MQDCLGNCTAQCEKQLWRYLSNSISYSYYAIYGEHYLGKVLDLFSLNELYFLCCVPLSFEIDLGIGNESD